MSEYIYKVLWFDDEIDQFEIDIDIAFQKNIEITGVNNAYDGLTLLRKENPPFDAIIIDGLFHKKAGQTVEGLNQTAFGEVAKELFKLKNQGVVIPWFIYSGQKSFVKDKNDLVEIFKDTTFAMGRIYDKNIDEDFEQLLEDIKKNANKIETTKIKQQFTNVFEVCSEEYIGQRAASDLMLLLKDLNGNSKNHFNTIRKIVEDLFIAFNKFQLLPNEFITPSVAINESSKFLSGKNHKGDFFVEKGYQHLEETHMPFQISSMLWNILNITQDGSHRSTVDKHVETLETSYLFQSVLYQLLDVLIWFKKHIDSNPKKENWKKLEENKTVMNLDVLSIEGTVINFVPAKGFAFLEPLNGGDNIFIPPNLVEENHLKEGDIIKGEPEEYIDNRTKEPRTRIKKIF